MVEQHPVTLQGEQRDRGVHTYEKVITHATVALWDIAAEMWLLKYWNVARYI